MTAELIDLKEKALAATPGPWEAVNWQGHHPSVGYYDDWYLDTNGKPCDYYESEPGEYKNNHWDSDRARKDLQYMAAANPRVILNLLEQLEQANAKAERIVMVKAIMPLVMDVVHKSIRNDPTCIAAIDAVAIALKEIPPEAMGEVLAEIEDRLSMFKDVRLDMYKHRVCRG